LEVDGVNGFKGALDTLEVDETGDFKGALDTLMKETRERDNLQSFK